MLFVAAIVQPKKAGAQKPSVRLSRQAIVAFRSGRSRNAMHLLRDAIRSDPEHGANRYLHQLHGTRIVSNLALQLGETEFARLLRDRPVLANHSARPGFRELKDWVVRGFAGQRTGFRVVWSGKSPVKGTLVSSSGPSPSGKYATIYVATKSPITNAAISHDEIWHSIVFELINLENVAKFDRLDTQVRRGRISKEAFVEEMFRLEYEGVQRTHGFYAYVYLPWIVESRIDSDHRPWLIELPGWWEGARQMFPQYARDAIYPWVFYSKSFDRLRRYGNNTGK